jgi:DNA-binding transcriptional LysR family regulator
MLKNRDYVYAVYLNKSFSKAAAKLYISQPSLSASIKKTEDAIGLPLFNRSTNPIQLTPAGEYYMASIEKIMAIEKEMAQHFSQLRGYSRQVVNIGGASFFCAYVLPDIIQSFRESYPQYTVNILEANAGDLLNCLRLNTVDLIIDVERLDTAMFDMLEWGKEYILLAVPAEYSINERLHAYRLSFDQVRREEYLAGCPAVDLKEFRQEPFLFLKKGNDMYKRGMKMCRQAGFRPKVAMYLDQLLTAYYIACSGKGMAFVRAGIPKYLEPTSRVFFYKINDENALRSIMLYYRKAQPLSAASESFIDFLQRRKDFHQIV